MFASVDKVREKKHVTPAPPTAVCVVGDYLLFMPDIL